MMRMRNAKQMGARTMNLPRWVCVWLCRKQRDHRRWKEKSQEKWYNEEKEEKAELQQKMMLFFPMALFLPSFSIHWNLGYVKAMQRNTFLLLSEEKTKLIRRFPTKKSLVQRIVSKRHSQFDLIERDADSII